jgi:SMC interacting uncharacterized protein involved in chromosome segregation
LYGFFAIIKIKDYGGIYMKLELEKYEIEKILNVINNRIEELRVDINDEIEDSEDELRQIIRDYKSLIKKIKDQT